MEIKEYLEKAKNRVIHEFEYKDGKYIQHYPLGGEHEMKPQDIVDCLNALATMDCDLQTAYAYIKGQREIIIKKLCNLIKEKALEYYYFQNDPKAFDGNLYLLSKFDFEENILKQIEKETNNE